MVEEKVNPGADLYFSRHCSGFYITAWTIGCTAYVTHRSPKASPAGHACENISQATRDAWGLAGDGG
ncbi:hypothetical protein KDK_30770 [Dictyobacter kobayashii]|uniref:Uncharacterized protein n=1 Tax=Dictyobacter kobayashii TaxID=2014872 RepID=A0A402AJH2_9CHLR|nr:hypothetical protein KDK_30770 [Dictyobacter kobayashii]